MWDTFGDCGTHSTENCEANYFDLERYILDVSDLGKVNGE